MVFRNVFNGSFRALMHFHTQTLNTTQKRKANCQGGAKNGAFNNEPKHEEEEESKWRKNPA